MSISQFSFHVSKPKDAGLVSALSDFVKEHSCVVTKLDVNFLGNNLNSTNAFNDSNLNAILKLNSELVSSLTMYFRPNSITLNEGMYIQFNREVNSSFDKLTIHPHQMTDNQHIPFFANVCSFFRKEFVAIDSSNIIKDLSTKAEQKALELLTAESRELKGISKNIILDQEKWRQKLEDDFEKRSEKLKSEYEHKNDEIIERERKLDERCKTIDDRASVHARRMIREKFLEEVKNRYKKFELTENTKNLRNAVNKFLFLLIILFGSAFIYSLLISFKLVEAKELNELSFGIKQAFLGIAFASTIVFYFRWHQSWFDRHAREEFQLKRVELDFERASWLVEIVGEWAENNKGQFPEALLGRLSEGLFQRLEDKHTLNDCHPADQLTNAVLGASSRLNLNLGNGSSIELDRKGINQLEKKVGN